MMIYINKKILFLILVSLYSMSNIRCQTVNIDNDSNLIYNPSFESHSSCPQRIDPYGIMDEVDAWWQPSHGSSDYYNNCGGKQCHVPKNKLGIQMPRTGESMVGIYCSLTDYREYIQTELKEKLKKGETYKLSFHVSLSEYSKGAVATLGGLFTTYRIADTTRQMLTDNQVRTLPSGLRQVVATFYKPQVVNNFERPLYDTENWQKIEGSFVAQGGERYLTIGNFYPEEQSNHIDPRNTTNILPGAYYYIDDVELYCLTCQSAIENNDATNGKSEVTANNPVDTVEYSVGKTVVLENIFFDFDKSVLLPQSYVALLQLTNLLNDNPKMKIELSGHTDNKGKDKYNEKLSEERAKAVYEYLIVRGIDKKRLKYRGYGAKHPIADNKTEDGRAKNRRVEFTITEL
ncbi:MAG: OmpA family protein [Bacteroidales bacterium]|nr:OmpA family protein [Bacteroidales bacterium]